MSFVGSDGSFHLRRDGLCRLCPMYVFMRQSVLLGGKGLEAVLTEVRAYALMLHFFMSREVVLRTEVFVTAGMGTIHYIRSLLTRVGIINRNYVDFNPSDEEILAK